MVERPLTGPAGVTFRDATEADHARFVHLVREWWDERPPRLERLWFRHFASSTVVGESAEGRPVALAVAFPSAGLAARGGSGLVWARPLAGRCQLLGEAELVVEPGNALLPLADFTWLVAAEPLRLSCVAGAVLLAGGGLWEGLASFHGELLAALALNNRRRAAAEREEARQRLELDRRLEREAVRRLAATTAAIRRSASGWRRSSAPTSSSRCGTAP